MKQASTGFFPWYPFMPLLMRGRYLFRVPERNIDDEDRIQGRVARA